MLLLKMMVFLLSYAAKHRYIGIWQNVSHIFWFTAGYCGADVVRSVIFILCICGGCKDLFKNNENLGFGIEAGGLENTYCLIFVQ